jgi:cysteinyl-tRNA synthetase
MVPQNFLSTVKAVVREQASTPHVFTGAHNYHEAEKSLTEVLHEKQASIHASLCDSINTPATMQEIRALISAGNSYYQDCLKAKKQPNADLLLRIGKYVCKIFRVFGVFKDENPELGPGVTGPGAESGLSGNKEEVVFPYVELLSGFRDRVRKLAQSKADHKEFLKLCDDLRDQECVELGVSLEDRGEKALVKLVDRLTLIEAREEKIKKELEKEREKKERLAAEEAKKKARLEQASVPPSEMFKKDPSVAKEFSEWDAQGIPTKDNAGEPVSKSRRKKLEKEYEKQAKLHQSFLDGTL